jgi:hypothetical protein
MFAIRIPLSFSWARVSLASALLFLLLSLPNATLAEPPGKQTTARTHASAVTASPPVIGHPFPIAAVQPNSEIYPTVAHDEVRGRYLVVYHNETTLNAQCITAQGHVLATYVLGSTPQSTGPDVAYNPVDDQYLVVFATSGVIEGAYVSGQCCSQVGCSSAPFTISGDRTGTQHYSPAVSCNRHTNHHDYLVVWEDGYSIPNDHWAIYARRVTSNHGFVTPSFAVRGSTNDQFHQPDVAFNLNHNDWLVVYEAQISGATSGYDIYGRRVRGLDSIVEAEHAIDTTINNQMFPTVAAYRPNKVTPYFVAYTDYWDDPSGSVRGILLKVDGTITTQYLNIAATLNVGQSDIDLASNERLGGYTAVWSEHDGDWNIRGRRITHDGILQPPFDISQDGALGQGMDESMPAVAGGAPTALVVWQQSPNITDYDIYGRFLGYAIYVPLVLRIL